MPTVINIQNRNFTSPEGYKTFLGEDLGFGDSINITYPEIERLYKAQRAQFWTETEFALDRDRMDVLAADKNTRDIMLLNLLTQWILDATASRGIIQTFGDFISNTQVLDMFLFQSMMEGIHARAYSDIVRVCYNNPVDAMEEAIENQSIIYRTKIIGEVFNETNRIKAKFLLGELKRDNPAHRDIMAVQLMKNLAVLYGLEAVSFMASFSCTFALTRGGVFQGIDKRVGAILKDEVLHAESARVLLESFTSEQSPHLYEQAKPEIKKIFDEIVNQEFHWAEYIFSEGRHVLGLDTELLQDYVCYVAKPCYDFLGIEWEKKEVLVNPLPYMDKYTNPDSIEAAPQEIEVSNYRVATVDRGDMDEEFDF